MSWSVLVAVGDRNGHVGIGLGKASGIPDAIRKSIEDAKKNIIEVPMVGTTIPHETEHALRRRDSANEAGISGNRSRCGRSRQADFGTGRR